jgi:CrcB protein
LLAAINALRHKSAVHQRKGSGQVSYILVFVGGGLGATLRHVINIICARSLGSGFPWNTFIINITGSLAMGLLIGILARTLPPMQAEIRLFVAVGVLGGYTTFSAFSLDAVTLWERGDLTGAGLYVVISVVVSILALFAGLMITRIGA